MTITDRIEINPGVMLRKPVIRGTRITAELMLRKLGEGANPSFGTVLKVVKALGPEAETGGCVREAEAMLKERGISC